MFYKTLAPGCIGHEVRFADAAEMTAACGFEGYWFSEQDFSGDPAETADLLHQFHLKAAGFGLPVEYRRGEQEYREGMARLPAYLDFAQRIGIRRCITWILPAHDRLSFSENFELHCRRLTSVAQMLRDHGMLFGLEFIGPKTMRRNARYEFIHDLDGMLQLCDAIGSGNCGILMDAWHWHMAGQKFEDFSRFTRPEQIVCAHIMDAPANIPDDEQEDQVRRLPGTTGVIHIEEFFAGLKKAGFDGPVLVEPFERFLSMIDLEEAVRITKKAMDSVWPA